VVATVPVSVSNVPSPSRSHSYLAIEPPGSLEAVPLKVTVAPMAAGLGVTVKEAVGELLLTKTLPGVVSWPPQLSVTFRLTLWTPVAA
jgi:hypothetical protein